MNDDNQDFPQTLFGVAVIFDKTVITPSDIKFGEIIHRFDVNVTWDEEREMFVAKEGAESSPVRSVLAEILAQEAMDAYIAALIRNNLKNEINPSWGEE